VSEFYTYLHCRPDGEPFYVGKGNGSRCRAFKRNRNQHYLNVVAKYGVENIKVFVFPCDSEQQAFDDEIRHIQQLRRDGYRLTNISDGGEGKSGVIPSAETRAKISAAGIGRIRSAEAIAKTAAANRGRSVSAETRLKMCVARKGTRHTDEARERMKVSNAGKKRFLGHTHSEESKKKTIETLKAYWQGRTGLSGHRGVGWHKASNKWRAYIEIQGRQKQLGVFADIDDAVAAVAKAQE
jgi:hypothetical protein